MISENPALYFNEYVCSHSMLVEDDETPIYGFYNREYVEIPAGRMTIEGYKPTFTLSTADADTIGKDASVTISGVSTSFLVAHVALGDEVESKLILTEE